MFKNLIIKNSFKIKNFKFQIVLVLYTLFLILSSAQGAYAANLAQSYLRLDRLKANTAISGLVCAEPSSAGASTEAKVSVTFPSDFTVSSTTSNWTTSTSNLPSGATTWPGIGSSAVSVSGQTVTFPGNDLTGTSLYCFNFTGASSTTGSSGEKTGTIATKNSSDSTIDSRNYGLTIIPNDQIAVTASIASTTQDFQNDLSTIESDEVFSQDRLIRYRVVYGLESASSTNMTLEVEWYKGTVEGESVESVNVLDYLVGSASTGYGSTAPVVDTVNRKIRWTFNSFPGNTTDQSVNLTFRTSSNYTGDKKVSFKVSSRITTDTTASFDSSVTRTYKYAPASISPSPSPTAETPLRITAVELREALKNIASIFVSVSKPASLIIFYGESPARLANTALAPEALSHLIRLTNLKPDTNYYFRIAARDQGGKTTSSDIFTFKTGRLGELPEIDLSSLVLTSGEHVIYDAQIRSQKLAIVPKNTPFQFKFALKGTVPAKKIEAVVRNKKVLGISTFVVPQAEANTETVELAEIEPNIYIGRLKTKPDPGVYEIHLKIHDYSDNIIETKLIDLRVTHPLTVLSKKDNSPLESTRVQLFLYNHKTGLYNAVVPAQLGIPNPSFTNGMGQWETVLPFGKYKAHLSNLGFGDKTVEFVIGESENDGYPIVYLTPQGFSLLNTVTYYTRSFQDVFLTTTFQYVAILGASIRFFNLVASLVLASLVLITLYAFSRKHAIPFLSLHKSFIYLLHRNLSKKSQNYISGTILDEEEKSISGANVYLLSEGTEEIVGKTQTNRHGEFFFRRSAKAGEFLVMAMKEGYKTHPILPYEENGDFKITVFKNLEHKHSPVHYVRHLFTGSFGLSFETLLVLSVFFEFVFITVFGLQKTLPFLLITLFNFFFWILLNRRRSHVRT